MTLMANGKKVIGYALGGTEFYSIGKNADGSSTIGGQDYFSTNKIKIASTGRFTAGFDQYTSKLTIDVTDNLVNYRGYLAILELSTGDAENDVIARPFSIPTTQTTDSLSFYNSNWSGSLTMNADHSFKLTLSFNDLTHYIPGANGKFYILSNEAT